MNVFRNNNLQDQINNKEEKKLLNKKDDFWNWYLWILQEARIVDTNYSVKGCYVWLDWGYLLYDKILRLAQETYQQMDHKQLQFPTLIKESTFMKETDFIRNFENDVFWVDREGHKELEIGERLALRPTSEMIIYPMFARWIRSWRDMPLKVFQNVSIFRCETNETRPLIRNRETIGFIEGHSAYATKEDALNALKEVWLGYSKLFSMLGIPVKFIAVPNWERFAGSSLTIDGYVILPGGKSMELCTTAYLGTTFSEIFNINYLDKEKKNSLVHLLCYGPSIDRILATIISLYGDNLGLKLLSNITPYEIIIIPIYKRKQKEMILQYAIEIQSKLESMNFKVTIDTNEQTTPGAKFFQAERLGIPLRIEIGFKEQQNNLITITRRDDLTKTSIKTDSITLEKAINAMIKDYDEKIKHKTHEQFNNSIIDLTIIDAIKKLQNYQFENDKMYKIGWCGSYSCAQKIEEQSDRSLLGFEHENKTIKNCIVCQNKGRIAIITKRY
ncbi:MAG: proline--tRNA ligase [Asgard group archaeon]|nr:proline--tRNA ligase [Asgard group archaeon]